VTRGLTTVKVSDLLKVLKAQNRKSLFLLNLYFLIKTMSSQNITSDQVSQSKGNQEEAIANKGNAVAKR
jgi:hypothetical protein